MALRFIFTTPWLSREIYATPEEGRPSEATLSLPCDCGPMTGHPT